MYEVALEPRAALMMAENAEPTLRVGHGTAAAPRAERRNATCRAVATGQAPMNHTCALVANAQSRSICIGRPCKGPRVPVNGVPPPLCSR